MKFGDGTKNVCTEGSVGSSMFEGGVPMQPRSTITHGRPPPSPPLPGILKGRVKHEN